MSKAATKTNRGAVPSGAPATAPAGTLSTDDGTVEYPAALSPSPADDSRFDLSPPEDDEEDGDVAVDVTQRADDPTSEPEREPAPEAVITLKQLFKSYERREMVRCDATALFASPTADRFWEELHAEHVTGAKLIELSQTVRLELDPDFLALVRERLARVKKTPEQASPIFYLACINDFVRAKHAADEAAAKAPPRAPGAGRPPAPPLPALVDGAAKIREKWSRDAEENAAADRASAEDYYARLLSRHVQSEPGDAEDLAMLMTVLGKDEAAVQADMRAIDAAIRLFGLLERREELKQANRVAIEELHVLEKRQPIELLAAKRKRTRATSLWGEAASALRKLTNLAERLPYLFDRSDPAAPPKLKGGSDLAIKSLMLKSAAGRSADASATGSAAQLVDE